MPENEKNNQQTEYLTREMILAADEEPKQMTLPSQKSVIVKYFSLQSIVDILSNNMNVEGEERGHLFSRQAVAFMLRENDIKDLEAFSSEDQTRLVEVAVKEWGCQEEYDELEVISPILNRFFDAAKLHETRQEQKIAKSLASLNLRINERVLGQFDWIDNYQKTISNLISLPAVQIPLPDFQIAPGALTLFAPMDLDQYLGLGNLNIGIARLAEEVLRPLQVLPDDFGLSLTKQMLSAYQSLMANISLPEIFVQLPESMRFYPSHEMRDSLVLDSYFQGDENVGDLLVSDPIENLLTWLSGYDKSFVDMLNGARQAIFSGNPDRVRHFASSHRELDTHILDEFAPEKEVSRWTDDNEHFHNGRPTRRARLLYIARNLSDRSIAEFFVTDGISQFKILNADEHARTRGYSDKLLLIMHSRFCNWLGFLKEIIEASDES